MNLFSVLTDGATGGSTGSMIVTILLYVVVLGGGFYLLLIRPQKKQQKQQDALMASLEIGDSILTSGGFYGVVIDVMEEVIIVEFGNNKNCRIPMKKSAVAEIEKANKE